jgi:hypothetical protein
MSVTSGLSYCTCSSPAKNIEVEFDLLLDMVEERGQNEIVRSFCGKTCCPFSERIV